jgi:hypothetical protein
MVPLVLLSKEPSAQDALDLGLALGLLRLGVRTEAELGHGGVFADGLGHLLVDGPGLCVLHRRGVGLLVLGPDRCGYAEHPGRE